MSPKANKSIDVHATNPIVSVAVVKKDVGGGFFLIKCNTTVATNETEVVYLFAIACCSVLFYARVCRLLLIFLPFSLWILYCMSFFYVRHVITPLVSSTLGSQGQKAMCIERSVD